MAYGRISFDEDERMLVEELLQSALVKNTVLQAAAEDDKEASFYRDVRPIIQSSLKAVQQHPSKTPFSEDQLKMVKGLLSSSFTELRETYQKAIETKAHSREDISYQWKIRDSLSVKLNAPFVADTSTDADEGLFEREPAHSIL
jgi:hypothetical protein